MARFVRRKECYFCKKKINDIDYKDVATIQRFLSTWSKIKEARETGNCARHQRAIATAVKRARFMALLPYASR